MRQTSMVTVSAAAKMLGTYPRQVQRLIKRGALAGAVKVADIPNAPYLIPLKSVEDYLKKSGPPQAK